MNRERLESPDANVGFREITARVADNVIAVTLTVELLRATKKLKKAEEAAAKSLA